MSSIPEVVNLPVPVARPDAASHSTLTAAQIGIFALACGLTVASTFYAHFMAAPVVVGLFAAATQVLAPFVFHLAAPAQRVLPQRRPGTGLAYARLLRSLPRLVARTAVLRRRGFYQAMMFAAFNIFWTGVPLLLAREFGFGEVGIALFTLAGAAGALAAPIAGRLADRGFTRPATGWALVAAVVAFVSAVAGERLHSLAFLVLAALILDAAVQLCQVLSLRSIYMLAPESRGRLNGLFIACAFLGGAIGSGLAPAIYTFDGWGTLANIGVLFVFAALLLYLSEFPYKGRRA